MSGGAVRALAAAMVVAAGALAPAAAQTPRIPGRAPAAKPEPRGPSTQTPITVDADKMERFGKEGLVVFSGNVVATQDGSTQYTDRMEVYLDERGDRVLRTVSTGNVRIVTKDCKMGSAQRAEYLDQQKLVRLMGDARVWDAENVVTGAVIDLYMSEDRSVVEGGKQGRVKAQFFPRDEKRDAARAPKPGGPCPN